MRVVIYTHLLYIGVYVNAPTWRPWRTTIPFVYRSTDDAYALTKVCMQKANVTTFTTSRWASMARDLIENSFYTLTKLRLNANSNFKLTLMRAVCFRAVFTFTRIGHIEMRIQQRITPWARLRVRFCLLRFSFFIFCLSYWRSLAHTFWSFVPIDLQCRLQHLFLTYVSKSANFDLCEI